MRKDWIKIKNYYITHNISLERLAEKYGASISAVNKHCRLEKWTEEKAQKKQEIDKKVSEKLTEKEIDRKVRANEKHIELYDNGLEIVEGLLKLYKEKLALSSANKVKVSADALDKVLSCIEKVQKGQRLALNIEKDAEADKTPKFVMVENLDLNKL